MIEGHGDDLHRYRGKIKYNFSSNVYYKGSPTELLREIAAQTQKIQHYPSPRASELSDVAANKFDLPSNQFLFTNGATEAFYLIAHAFSDRKAAIVAPTFSEYEDACRIHGLDYELIGLSGIKSKACELVFICNPNNPDGSFIPTEELVKRIQNTPSTIFVIDEAYIEFTNQISSIISWVKELPNLIVVRSLTKTFAIPGIRLGYIVASSEVIASLDSKKMPWSVNTLAIQAGLKLFERYDQWQFDVEELLTETQEFIQALSSVEWLKVLPTSTSYFLVQLYKGFADQLKSYLADQHGILVRDATNFARLKGEYIRLSTQSPEANECLINALKNWK